MKFAESTWTQYPVPSILKKRSLHRYLWSDCGDPVKECTCSPSMITRYRKRICSSLLDRIDIHTEVPRVGYEKLIDDRLGGPSANIPARIEKGP